MSQCYIGKTTKQFARGILSFFTYLLFICLFRMRMCIDSITITTSLKEEAKRENLCHCMEI